jgi:predicted nucleic acid-binding Zn ribbon protein
MPEKPNFTDDWEKERKKLRALWLVFIGVVAVVVVLFIIP